jgi:ADP-heptose:LPS heptosyltransferase
VSKKKILIIRFSSIGDIVLTTPVIRCIKKQLKAEVHVVTKEVFFPVLKANPYIDKLHTFKKEVTEVFKELKAEKFDHVIDLHNNLRSLRLKKHLGVKANSFDKINLKKFAAVNFKMVSSLPKIHIVERYLQTVKEWGVEADGEGLDYFLTEEDKMHLPAEKYTVLVVGGSYFTKKIPMNKLKEICSNLKGKIVLLGGNEDKKEGDLLEKEFANVASYCGKCTIGQSAFMIKHSEFVITGDTGLMHIGSAFNKKIISLWGNTIPEFGMAPYKPNRDNKILQVEGLKCRPCSKLGFHACPKKHFKCMNDIEVNVS